MDVVGFLEGGGAGGLGGQGGGIDHLNIFIACLKDSDITEYKHVVPFWFREDYMNGRGVDGGDGYSVNGDDGIVAARPNAGFDFSTKVNRVCVKMRDVMTEYPSPPSTPLP